MRALSISGAVEIRCVRGRVDVSNAEGPVTLAGVNGDVNINSTTGAIRFAGPLSEDGRYHLKSMSGDVEMWTGGGAGAPGFTVVLSSYRGTVETDFPIRNTRSSQHDSADHRLMGRFGNGRAQITLDSFDGAVRLKKAAANESPDCQ